jgi:hypothetical protein
MRTILRKGKLVLIRAVLTSAIFFTLPVGIACAEDRPVAAPEINTILMESTFRIHGPKKDAPEKISFGTAFLMGKPMPDKSKFYYVLITAGHVLEDIAGEVATLTLREKHDDGSYTPKLWNVKLREQGTPLYVKHKDVDVVALYVNMPNDLNVPILPIALLADDDVLQKFEIHPGDELRCLGFPLFASDEAGFPILRSGIIASYPIVPTKTNKSILFDFNVFEGNSGGPVYFVDHGRTYGGLTHVGETEQFVLGLVTSQLGAKLYNNQMLGLASVVPATYILQTINLLPATSPSK